MTGAPQYLLVLYVAEREGAGPVEPGTVADAVDRSPAATTEMLHRLDERGLVDHEPYEGATLTPEGRETARTLYKTYAILSRFFDEVLDLADYEAEAMRLVGAVSPAVAERLASTLLADSGVVSDGAHPSVPPNE